MSAQANRQNVFSIGNSLEKRQSVTAAEGRPSQHALFSPEEMENLKLNNLREKRKELEEKLKSVSNKINFRRKKEEQELRKFIRSEEKSLSMMETHNFKRLNEMIKEELEQKRDFETRKKAKLVEEARIANQRRLHLINQSVRDRKMEESEKLRYAKKMDEETLKYTRDMSLSIKKEQHEIINKMKERQHAKKRCFWFERKISFQQKLQDEASLYEKQIEQYYSKIEALKECEEKLKEQEQQALEVLKTAEQNYSLLKNS